MKIFITSDHNGVSLVKYLKENLSSKYEIISSKLENNELDDYPLFAFELSNFVSNNKDSMGIILCGTGIGVSIACNKVKGIRCARVCSMEDAIKAREHNNANVIALGSNYTEHEVLTLVETFINTKCLDEERHIRRNNEINKYELGEYNEL